MIVASDRTLHILVVFTGGTIASQRSGETIALNEPPYFLLSAAPPRYSFATLAVAHLLSENMTPPDLLSIFTEIRKELRQGHYDGLILTHGTDTLAYTAQLASFLLSDAGIPVVLFGSKIAPNVEGSDARDNFLNALTVIRETQEGVFVVGRTGSGDHPVHAAENVVQADFETDDAYSFHGLTFGRVSDGVLCRNPHYSLARPGERRCAYPFPADLPLYGDRGVFALDAVVGNRYDLLDISRPEIVFYLQRTFHSGTANAANAAPYSLSFFAKRCHSEKKRVFLAPLSSAAARYSSLDVLLEAGVTPLFDMPFEAAWAALTISAWAQKEPEEIFPGLF